MTLISVIVPYYKKKKFIEKTINSILSQTYKNIEHIVVDGGSKDKTLSILKKYKNKNKKIFIKKGFGIYKSINYGIKKARGDYIMILNSDDIFFSNHIVKNLVNNYLKKGKYEIYLGNVVYFKQYAYEKIERYYAAKNFNLWKMKFGLMPPHPSSIIAKKTYHKNGFYNENFRIAGDFDLFLRFLNIKKIGFKIIDKNLIRMRTGGVSGKNFLSYWISTIEILR